jgi:hypothetical protein
MIFLPIIIPMGMAIKGRRGRIKSPAGPSAGDALEIVSKTKAITGKAKNAKNRQIISHTK